MKLRLGDVLLWDGVNLEVVAIDSKVVHLRAIDDGFLRKVLIDELYRSTDIQWPEAFRRPRLAEVAALERLSAEQRRIVDAWLPLLRRLDHASDSSSGERSERTEDIVLEICGEPSSGHERRNLGHHRLRSVPMQLILSPRSTTGLGAPSHGGRVLAGYGTREPEVFSLRNSEDSDVLT